jgi:protein-disulfide isomerase
MDKKNLPFIFLGFFSILVIASASFFYFQQSKKSASRSNTLEKQSKNNKQDIKKEDEAMKSLADFRIQDDDYILGASSSQISLVVYDDPSEPFAPTYYENLKTLLAEFSPKLNLVLRLLPLEGREDADAYSMSVLCAGEQGKFFEAYEAMLLANKEKRLTISAISSILEGLGFDQEKFELCRQNADISKRLAEMKQDAADKFVIGVPSTFINNYSYPGAYPLDDFVDSGSYSKKGLRAVIEEELNKL